MERQHMERHRPTGASSNFACAVAVACKWTTYPHQVAWNSTNTGCGLCSIMSWKLEYTCLWAARTSTAAAAVLRAAWRRRQGAARGIAGRCRRVPGSRLQLLQAVVRAIIAAVGGRDCLRWRRRCGALCVGSATVQRPGWICGRMRVSGRVTHCHAARCLSSR